MRYLITITILSLFIFSCTEEAAVHAIQKPVQKVKPLNPNGDSELALLMRLMADETTAIQKALKKGENLGELSDYSTLHSATPTEEGMNEGEFQGFATIYLAKIADFKTANEAHKKEAFNGVINACMSCHEVTCRGPIMRIKKMYVK